MDRLIYILESQVAGLKKVGTVQIVIKFPKQTFCTKSGRKSVLITHYFSFKVADVPQGKG